MFSVAAVDGDRGINNPIAYSITSNGLDQISDIFMIDKDTGIVSTTNTIDREALSSNSATYIFHITVST